MPSAFDAAPRGASSGRALPATLRETLVALMGSRFTTNPAVCLAHGKDHSSLPAAPPDAVAFPLNTQEVAFILRACQCHRVPVIAFGSGTSSAGHTLAVAGGICVDLSRMKRVLSVDADDLTATVQPGVTSEGLQDVLEPSGLFFPIEPGEDATLGGMVATGASGTRSVRYGTMRDNVLALTVVTADGLVVRTGRRARRSAAGYSLTQLFAGSEGTLGIITEAVLRLQPRPETAVSAVVQFSGLINAVRAVESAVQAGVQVARAELMDAWTVRAVNARSDLGLRELPSLLLEFTGSITHVQEQSAALQAIAQDEGGDRFRWVTARQERTRLWQGRSQAFSACMQLEPGHRAWTVDACVPVSALARCVADTLEDIRHAGVTAPIFGHAAVGNFLCMVLADPDKPDAVRLAEHLVRRITARVLAADGSCTGESGVGISHIGLLEAELGAGATEVMRRIKRALDPHNILNPGKLVRLDVDDRPGESTQPRSISSIL